MKITFQKSASGTNGEPYEAAMMSIAFPDSVPESLAIARAVKEFEEHAGVSHWQQAADRYIIT